MNENLYAWAAGFFDGEGNITISKEHKARTYQLHLSVSQVGLDPINMLNVLFPGGRLCKTHKGTMYTWQANGNAAMAALELMVPYMIQKRNEAYLAIEFQKNRQTKRSQTTSQEEVDRQHSYIAKIQEARRVARIITV